VITGAIISEVEGGTAMVWLPNGAMAVAAPDRRGDLQMRLVLGEGPIEFRQMTYLAGGIAPQMALSGNGTHVLAATEATGTPAVISLVIPVDTTSNLR
jgi:hypothetical protein